MDYNSTQITTSGLSAVEASGYRLLEKPPQSFALRHAQGERPMTLYNLLKNSTCLAGYDVQAFEYKLMDNVG
jgi:hypothetical protein